MLTLTVHPPAGKMLTAQHWDFLYARRQWCGAHSGFGWLYHKPLPPNTRKMV